MDITKEKSESFIEKSYIANKNISIINSKLPLKGYENKLNLGNDVEKILIKSNGNKKVKKKAKFKQGKFVEIVKVESYKKYNYDNNFNNNGRSYNKKIDICKCVVF